MATCLLNKNLLKSNSCDYSLPEVKDIYIANFGEWKIDSDYSCESGVTVTTITSVTTGASWYHIEPTKDSVSWSDNLEVRDGGGKHRVHTITFGLSGKYDKDMPCPVDALSLGRFVVVVATADGQYLALGRTVGMEASEQSIAGGSDSNGITVTLTANVAETAVPLNETAVNVVLGKS
jgi:hypothetical protein